LFYDETKDSPKDGSLESDRESVGEACTEFILNKAMFTSWLEWFWRFGHSKRTNELLGSIQEMAESISTISNHEQTEDPFTEAVRLLDEVRKEQDYLFSS
jgi:hypothetical protein